ncbi:hypothetical protein [[Flexibacter] sp. ATCC 35208]|uniref:hypothetical protein n=1 Tax=[Flexibacter] sp. ATCC 35208 TaxID=1936242 RepID=UPI0009D06F40|nr:hypothetical protein [[Flexibacter] sp. ATCC 35208]OMP78612.1 hypothetical protein BW716_14135 [[Flexibacter] sp. ATCC 35208]
MKRILFIVAILAILCVDVKAQLNIDTTITLDVLKSPVSPAFNMLGISTSAIERPSDLNSFRLSVQNATNNLTAIPNSYAFEIAPFLWGAKKYTLKDFDSTKHAFLQSFTISAGFTHMGPEGQEDVDSLKTTKVAIGIKFAIIRPRWSANTRKAYLDLIKAQEDLLKAYELPNMYTDSLEILKNLRAALGANTSLPNNIKQDSSARLRSDLQRMHNLVDSIQQEGLPSSEPFQRAKAIAAAFPTERKGVFLDFTTGMVADFPDNRFDNSLINKAGAWLTGGYENGNKGITSMFIVRYLYHPEVIFADPDGKISADHASTFDVGARFLLSTLNDKFTLSGEGLYRSVIGNTVLDPSWRLVLSTEYEIAKNRKVTFSFGRNFDGAISKGGNLIAAINFIAGFGGERKVK